VDLVPPASVVLPPGEAPPALLVLYSLQGAAPPACGGPPLDAVALWPTVAALQVGTKGSQAYPTAGPTPR